MGNDMPWPVAQRVKALLSLLTGAHISKQTLTKTICLFKCLDIS